jgi:ACT domain-containing protein
MKAVISVTGKDGVGIVAKVSTKCAEYGANIIDISQTVLDGYFVMIMITNVDDINVKFGDFVDSMASFGKENGLQINTMHEDIFNSMHKI